MNIALRRAVQSICTLQQCTAKARLLSAGAAASSISPSVCKNDNYSGLVMIPYRSISKFERPYRYVVRAKKKKEMFKHPERFATPTPRYNFVEWNYTAEIYAFGKRLGETFDDGLLREALTDRSYIHKERKKQEELGIDTAVLDMRDNEELSELGTQITKSVLLEFVRNEIPSFPAEGHNALIKYLMDLETMGNVGLNLGLKDLILCEEYPPTNETFARSMFAIIGTLEKSSGLERAQKFVIDFVASLLCNKDINDMWDIARPWQLMTEMAKHKGLYPVEARLMREAGRNTIHAAFLVGIYDKDRNLLGQGPGESIDIAQEMAARDVLRAFFNTRDPMPPYEFQSAHFPYKLVPHVRNIHKS
jgi:large subunit ribosomal protein L44